MFVTESINGISFLRIDGQINNGTILIFLSGIGTCKENYIDHLDSFKSYYETIYSMDLPEQGSKGNWTIGNHVNNLKEFIRILDNSTINKIHLAGHSAGALAIISFLVNYNCDVEYILMESGGEKENNNEQTKKLEGAGFGQKVAEANKVDKLFLYAPPYSFNDVFPRTLSRFLGRQSQSFIKSLLNIFINRPMQFFQYFGKNEYFRFSINKTSQPQYFNLILSNYKAFFDYVSKYETIFEIYEKLDSKLKLDVSKRLEEKSILIQFGSLDWLLKPGIWRKADLENRLKMKANIKVIKHKYLGHVLNHKFRLDINLNHQMITNNTIIKISKEF